MRGIRTHVYAQHLVTDDYWRHFLLTYGDNPYFATMLWCSMCDHWQRRYGMFN